MSFHVSIETFKRESCDKCGKDTGEAIIFIDARFRECRSCIWVHESCLLKAVAKAKAKAGAQ